MGGYRPPMMAFSRCLSPSPRPLRRWAYLVRRPMLVSALLLVPVLGACRDDGPTDVVPPAPPATVQVSSLVAAPAAINLQTGQQRTIATEARDSTGRLVADPGVTWRSDAPAIATVDGTGTIRALAPGTARITAVAGRVSALIQVTVGAVTPAVDAPRFQPDNHPHTAAV